MTQPAGHSSCQQTLKGCPVLPAASPETGNSLRSQGADHALGACLHICRSARASVGPSPAAASSLYSTRPVLQAAQPAWRPSPWRGQQLHWLQLRWPPGSWRTAPGSSRRWPAQCRQLPEPSSPGWTLRCGRACGCAPSGTCMQGAVKGSAVLLSRTASEATSTGQLSLCAGTLREADELSGYHAGFVSGSLLSRRQLNPAHTYSLPGDQNGAQPGLHAAAGAGAVALASHALSCFPRQSDGLSCLPS